MKPDIVVIEEVGLLIKNYYTKYGKAPNCIVSSYPELKNWNKVLNIDIYHAISEEDFLYVGCDRTHMYPNAFLCLTENTCKLQLEHLISRSGMPWRGFVVEKHKNVLRNKYLHLEY